jgi:colanic acid biosynthesis glycosyl transferase WcaI
MDEEDAARFAQEVLVRLESSAAPTPILRSDMSRRPRLLVLNQYYWPGHEATAVLLTELCEYLVDFYDVTVITGLLHDPQIPAGGSERNGVRVVRVHSTYFERRRISLRGLNYLTYLGMSGLTSAFARRPDAVIAMTDPPIAGVLAAALGRRWRVPVVTVYQDVFPEIAVELGRLESPVLARTLSLLSSWVLRNSTRVVAIGDTMKRRLVAKGARPESVVVIPNWTHLDRANPTPKQNDWARQHGLDDKFVVMHSGNIGFAQDLDTLIRASTFVRDREEIEFAIIGSGARLPDAVALAERLEADKVRFLPYQPREILSSSLSSADIHVVGLARGLSGFVVPSRLYGILAVGRPVIVAAESDSETALLVEREGCGVVIPPERPDLLAAAIRQAAGGVFDLAEMGQRGRAYIEREGSFERSAARYLELLDSLTRRGAAGQIAA